MVFNFNDAKRALFFLPLSITQECLVVTLLRFKKCSGSLRRTPSEVNVAFVFNIFKELPTYGFSSSTKHPGYVYILFHLTVEEQ